MGALRPGAVPVTRPSPATIAQEQWSAYRLEPATEAIIFPAERLKRMGRGQAMAIGAVSAALKDCASPPGKATPTAVALGTANAEEADEVAFLENIVKFGEKGAKPAFFVNSVKNALASQVALQFGWQGENQSFVHDALSFETALWGGARLLTAGRAERAVVVGVDALAEFQEIHGHLLGWYRNDPSPLSPLAANGVRGTLPGEGAAAFVLAASGAVASPLAHLAGVRARGPATRAPTLDAQHELAFIERSVLDLGITKKPDLVLLGANGEPGLDAVYSAVAERLKSLMPGAAMGVYRHLTGDFPTASALALELAVRAVSRKAIPSEVRVVAGACAAPSSALLYHLSADGYHSVVVVSA
jgi:3-oxoacyl-(acyl-carrier-protein) synthase